MSRYKKISTRLIALLGIYFLLLFFSKIFGLDASYNRHFINKGNYLFSSFDNGGEVQFLLEKNKSTKSQNECSIQLSSQQQKKAAIQKAKQEGKMQVAYHPVKISINTWNHFGILLLFFVGCIVVLPITWKHKLLVSIVTYLLIETYFYIKLWTRINLEFSKGFDQFKVGWQNSFLVDLLNYFHLIISFPFFGLLFVFVVIVFISKRFVVL